MSLYGKELKNLKVLRYRQNKDVAWRVIDNEAYLITPGDSKLHNFNQVGTKIWQLLEGGITVPEITKHICQEYEVKEEEAKRDIEEFINKLIKKKMVVVENN